MAQRSAESNTESSGVTYHSTKRKGYIGGRWGESR